jgi:23S rRNA (cytosine1962-C5)-methyltransferase
MNKSVRKDLISKPEGDYVLLDIGNGRKYEQYGDVLLDRPDPQAVTLPGSFAWNSHAAYIGGEGGGWKKLLPFPEDGWIVNISGIQFHIKPHAFKHTGVFPEHAPHWEFLKSIDKNNSVINFFGYTGAATVASALSGASVCHVDASKVAVQAASDNARLNNLGEAKIRWIVDDALAFAKREKRRNNTYTGVIMDPPAFGRGPQGQVWKIEEELLPFVEAVIDILASEPSFVLLNGYAAGYGADAYMSLLRRVLEQKRLDLYKNVKFEYGDMGIAVKEGSDVLAAGIYVKAFWK